MDKIKGVGCGKSVIKDKCLVVSVQGKDQGQGRGEALGVRGEAEK